MINMVSASADTLHVQIRAKRSLEQNHIELKVPRTDNDGSLILSVSTWFGQQEGLQQDGEQVPLEGGVLPAQPPPGKSGVIHS